MEKPSLRAVTEAFLDGSTISDKVLLSGVTAWCLAIVAAPLLDLTVIYSVFSAICHQYPERSWFLLSQPLAVCIRCTSIYFGFLASLMLRIQPKRGFLRFAVALTAIEFAVAHLVMDVEVVRSLSGMLLGLAAGGFVAQGVRELSGPLGRIARRISFENV